MCIVAYRVACFSAIINEKNKHFGTFFFFLEKYKWVSSMLQHFRQFLLSDVESFFTFMTPEVNKRGNREDKTHARKLEGLFAT